MRIPQWLVMGWVVGMAILSGVVAVLTYGFVRNRTVELDRIIQLPESPKAGEVAGVLGDLINPPDEKQGESSAPPVVSLPQETPTLAVTVQPSATEESAAPVQTPEPDAAAPLATAEVTEAVAAAAPEIQPWQDPRRVTVLLLGIDQRAGEEGTFPTDTIIVLSMDPVAKTGAILSVPRDLWVTYPMLNNQAGRINGANIIGDQVSYPGGGGPELARKTAETVLGIKIQYYVLLNFEVFNTLIDTVGPIQVCPQEPIDDDRYPDGSYGYITIHFDAGCQELDSEKLLQYARTRHGDSDIGRSSRQQEVILAVRDKILSTGGIMALLPKAQDLWNSMQDNIRTNLTFEDILSLAQQAQDVPQDNIRQGQIGFEEVQLGQTAEGDEILVPIQTDILLLVQNLFRPPDAASAAGQ